MNAGRKNIEIGSLFEHDHPLNQLVRESGARLVINPQVLMHLIVDNPQGDQILGFIKTAKSTTQLVEVPFNDQQIVGIKLTENDAEPITLPDGRLLAVLPLHSMLKYLAKKSPQSDELEIASTHTETQVVPLPPQIQEIGQALSTQSPILGNLEIRRSQLNSQLFTIHQKDVPQNGLSSVAMPELYLPMSNGQFRKSSISKNVIGYYLPTAKEVDKPLKLAQKVLQLKKQLLRTRHNSSSTGGYYLQDEVNIAVVTDKQLDLWRKINFFTELIAYKEGSPSLREVLKIVKAEIGDYCAIQVQHITNGEADLVFVSPNSKLPSDLSAFDVALRNAGKEIERITRVIGLMLVPDGFTEREKKTQAKKVSATLRLLYTGKSLGSKLPNILAVDQNLLTYWKTLHEKGEKVFTIHENLEQDSYFSKKSVEQIGKSDVVNIIFNIFEQPKPGIGAKYMEISVEYGDGHIEKLLLDHGAQFEGFPWDGLMKPSFAMGISPLLPYLPPYQQGLYRRTLLLREAQVRGKYFFVPENPIASDLALQLGLEQFTHIAEQLGVEDAMVSIPKLFGEISKDNTHYLGVVYSHAHIDHFGEGGALSTLIPVITTEQSIPFLEALFLNSSGGYLGEAVFRRQKKSLLTERSNRTFTPPLYLPEPFEEILLGRGQVGVTLIPVCHSVLGAAMTKIRVRDQFGKVIRTLLYTGDFNFEDKEIMDEATRASLDVDTIITDTTNLRPDAYNKPSVGVTREIMTKAFRRDFSSTDESSVVELAWNNPRDLHMIQQIAHEFGNNIYVPPKMATLLYLLQELDETTQKIKTSYPWRTHNPIPILGSDVYPWINPKMTFRKGEKMLMEMMDVETHASLQEVGKHVLIVPPNPMLNHTLGNAQMTMYSQIIRDHYWPYNRHDQRIFKDNIIFARRHNLPYKSDLQIRYGHIARSNAPQYHMSGHAAPEQILAYIHYLATFGQLKNIIPVHGDSRTFAAAQLRGQGDLVVYDRYSKKGIESILLYNR